MRLKSDDLAQLIDISAVQAPHGKAEAERLARIAEEHPFKAVHVLPCWVRDLRRLIGENPRTAVGAPIGFPGGGHTTAVKLAEARGLIDDGVQEMDIMLNVGKHRSGEDGYVEDEIGAIVELARAHRIPTKVILEVCYLSPQEIVSACEICIRAGADFVKTSTGWAPGGATLEAVELIASIAGDRIGVKAAGGVRNLETVGRMYRMGVRRFGINTDAALAILAECAARPGSLVDL